MYDKIGRVIDSGTAGTTRLCGLGPRMVERAQTPSPLSHQYADHDNLLQPEFYHLSAISIKTFSISKVVTVIFII
jgi:hypothetical protein